jgi:hypothetical protein
VNLKRVCFLLCLCHAGYATALGLGEISVRSYLGQPLHATVPILGATPDTTAECFSLGASSGNIAPPPHTQLSVSQSGGQMVLHIRTPQSINDPIAQFDLVSDCESRLRREYVVLLDPPAQITPVSFESAPADASAAALSSTASEPTRALIRPRRAKYVQAATARPSASPSRPSAAPQTRSTVPDASPRLVLSGKHGRFHNGSLALQFDTNLPDMNRPLPSGLSETDLSDENTALNHKLAHLESQLVELQQKNTELEANRVPAPAKPQPQPSGNPSQWPMYLLAAGLVAGLLALIVWLRRRSQTRATYERHTETWIPPGDTITPIQDQMESDPWELPAIKQAAKPPAPQRMPEISPQRMPEIAPPPAAIESTEVKDDILDQAEVFMAHGHGEIAINLLQEHVRDAPDESPVPWLLLLDLLHRENDTAGYAAASAECRRHFNINLTGHPVSQDNDSGRGLEAYPHLLEQLEKVWGTPSTDDFFRDLLYDNRGGTRVGFEPSAYRDILMLRTIAQNVHPLTV